MPMSSGDMLSILVQVRKRITVSGLIEVGGMGAIVAGVWMIFEPAAVIIAGSGAILWAQGVQPRRKP
jgi:hypothetical protein